MMTKDTARRSITDGLDKEKPLATAAFSFIYGGEGGIRTLEAFRLTHFPGVLLRPLGHLSSQRQHSV